MTGAKVLTHDFRIVLHQEFVSRCRRNPKYSIRSFARFLETDFSTLAKIMNGKRKLGRRAIERYGARLGMSQESLAPYINKDGKAVLGQPYQQIANDTFRIIADWHHYAILELMRLDHFQADSKWVAKTLGISLQEVNFAIERLERCGMLAIDVDGGWRDLTSERSTNDASFVDKPDTSSAHRTLQRQVLEKAIVALEQVPIEHRDQSSMTMAIDRNRLPEARHLIRSFRRELAQFLSRGDHRHDVYHLGISLYPVTQIFQETV